MNSAGRNRKIRIIRMRNVLSLDATGLNALREQHKNSLKHGESCLLLKGSIPSRWSFWLLKAIGEENIFGNLDDALNRAKKLLSELK